MRIIPPITVTDTNLTSSNVPENDAAAWDIGTTYAAAALVIYDHAIYESIAGSNVGNQPDTAVLKWLRLSATNRYKAFDKRLSDPTTQAESINYVLAHDGVFVGAFALFGMKGTTLEIVVTDPADGVVFSKTYNLIDETSVVDWYTYYFSPIGVQQTEVLEINIPPYTSASTSITVTNAGGTAEIAQIVYGRDVDLGVTTMGVNVSIEDYSRKERDAFGNVIIVEREFSQTADFDIKIPTSAARRVQSLLSEYRTTPTVWIGDEREELATIIYGYYRNFDITLSSRTISDVTIEVEGLV
jgi:hypothetical protein